jgi:tetratricopeptide (TPR) repeat protein
MARLYQAADLLEPALAQFDRWIASHPDDSKMAAALGRRCRIRALHDVDLPKALADCNAALRRGGKSTPGAEAVLDSRGLLRLRLGDYDKAIDDFDDSLRLAPKMGWALYGRGIAKLRTKKVADGEADIAQAESLSPTVADEFKRRGILP